MWAHAAARPLQAAPPSAHSLWTSLFADADISDVVGGNIGGSDDGGGVSSGGVGGWLSTVVFALLGGVGGVGGVGGGVGGGGGVDVVGVDFAAGCSALSGAWPATAATDALLAAAGVVAIGVGDSVASLVGSQWGRFRFGPGRFNHARFVNYFLFILSFFFSSFLTLPGRFLPFTIKHSLLYSFLPSFPSLPGGKSLTGASANPYAPFLPTTHSGFIPSFRPSQAGSR
jgi:hypothetical protein